MHECPCPDLLAPIRDLHSSISKLSGEQRCQLLARRPNDAHAVAGHALATARTEQ